MSDAFELYTPPLEIRVNRDDAELARLCASLSAPGCKAVQAITLTKLRALYLKKHPDAEGKLHQAHAANKAQGHNVAANLSPTFVKFVVDHTGLGERTVFRLAEWGQKIPAELLQAVANTRAHGQGVLLTTLAGLPEAEQEQAFRSRPAPPPPVEHPLFDAFVKLFEKANERVRAEDSVLIQQYLKSQHAGGR